MLRDDISIQYFSKKKYMKQSKLLYYIKSERIIHNNVNITNQIIPPRYNWNIVESGVKHHKPNQPNNQFY
jgi:hypothetical protein